MSGQPSNPQINTASSSASAMDRWEVLFVYGFVERFTSLRGSKQCPTFNTPMDLENAVLANCSTMVMHAILEAFVQNLWWKKDSRGRKECKTAPEGIERTLGAVITKYASSVTERSVWWSATRRFNDVSFLLDPSKGFFFTAEVDLKLKTLRQLVEWQLVHCDSIKKVIDDAWGIKHHITSKSKLKAMAKSQKVVAKEEPTREDLELIPIGMDNDRKRYWITDSSPRIWVSGNPWKTACTFRVVTSTREEIASLIASLKQTQSSSKKDQGGSKRLGPLIEGLEARLPLIIAEEERLERVAKKQVEREAAELRRQELLEMREIRTRSRTGRVQLVQDSDGDSEHESKSDNSEYEDEALVPVASTSPRLTSARTSRASSKALSGASNRKVPAEFEWRGERRSSRFTGKRYQLDEDVEMARTTDEDFDAPFDQPKSVPAAHRSRKRRTISPEASDAEEDGSRKKRALHVSRPAIADEGSSATPSLMSDGTPDVMDSSSPLSSVPSQEDDSL